MLCTIAELCNLETGLILRIRFYPRILLQSDARTAAVLGAEEGDKAGNSFSGSIPFLLNFAPAAAVFSAGHFHWVLQKNNMQARCFLSVGGVQ